MRKDILVASKFWKFDRKRDIIIGLDWPGNLTNGWHQYLIDELEIGSRAASQLGDPFQLINQLVALEENILTVNASKGCGLVI